MSLCVEFVELLLYVCVFVVNIYVFFTCCLIIDKPVHSCIISVL